jgi:hypothetical protein
MSQQRDQRRKCLKQYVIFRIKLIEFIHLLTITTDILARGQVPENIIDHTWKHFSETTLNALMNQFVTFTDPHKGGLDIRRVWGVLFPKHQRAIDRCWDRHIQPGWMIIVKYRDNAGAHSGHLEKYLDARGTLAGNRKIAIETLKAFLSLATSLMHREQRELLDFPDFIESALLDIEIKTGRSFKRRWLREWKLIESGPFSKRF